MFKTLGTYNIVSRSLNISLYYINFGVHQSRRGLFIEGGRVSFQWRVPIGRSLFEVAAVTVQWGGRSLFRGKTEISGNKGFMLFIQMFY